VYVAECVTKQRGINSPAHHGQRPLTRRRRAPHPDETWRRWRLLIWSIRIRISVHVASTSKLEERASASDSPRHAAGDVSHGCDDCSGGRGGDRNDSHAVQRGHTEGSERRSDHHCMCRCLLDLFEEWMHADAGALCVVHAMCGHGSALSTQALAAARIVSWGPLLPPLQSLSMATLHKLLRSMG
jgi:hypothetical protein